MARYDFSKQDDVLRFDNDLNEYAKKRGIPIDSLCLPKYFSSIFQVNHNLFYAIVDLKINVVVLYCDSIEMLEHQKRGTPEETFEFYRYLTSFIVRYRAMYDKFMSFVIQVGYPERQRDFEKAKSKNNVFYKILSKSPAFKFPSGKVFKFDPSFIRWLYEFVNELNAKYRSPEVHGSGSVRKWVFSPIGLSDTPFDSFFAGTSSIITILGIIKIICDEIATVYDLQ